MEEAKCEQCNFNIQHVPEIFIFTYTKFPPAHQEPGYEATCYILTADDYFIELCTDIHWYLYIYMLLCLTCFITISVYFWHAG